MTARSAAKTFVKVVVGAANRPVARVRMAAATRRMSAHRRVKLQIGGGSRPLPGWLNTDIGWNASHYLDITKPWPIPDETVTHIYGDNVVEHVKLQSLRFALREALRVLEPGGRIRFATPDLGALVAMYLNADEHLEEFSRWYRAKGFEIAHPPDMLRLFFHEWGHDRGYLFDFPSLEAELVRAGFTAICLTPYGDSQEAAFRGLEKRVGLEASVQMTVEAAKPARSRLSDLGRASATEGATVSSR